MSDRQLPFTVRRLDGNPILHRDTTTHVGRNINGPSLIAAPPWLEEPLGRYYLYFAHHRGTFIRLATADELTGPWRIYEPGTLHLAESLFPADGRRPHIASPDVHVDEAAKTIRMYYHGLDTATRVQYTRVATSTDGIHFEAGEELLGRPYFRVFRHDGWWYALGMPGILYRSADGLTGFEPGPRLFDKSMRHSALLIQGDELLVFWTRVGDRPERILCSPVALDGDWSTWRAGPEMEVLAPGESWEGAGEPLEPSERGWADDPVHQLRDPAIFQENDQAYLLYSVAGESGIAIAELEPARRPAPRDRLAGLLTRIDPGLIVLRQSAVVMAATLASFGTALLIEHFAHLSTSILILAVALTLSIGRTGQRSEYRSPLALALAVVVLPFVAVGANEIGTRIFQQPDLGDTLFVLALSATIWVRRFGPVARQIAVFATFPLIAMLIVPAPVVAVGGSASDARWWSALVALIAFAYVTASRLLAERAGFLEPATPAPGTGPVPKTPSAAKAGSRPARRIAPSTKMALQMAVALGAAFAAGRAAFGPAHWTWVVLTAFIVCSGNRGRGDVVSKAAMRLIGAGVGTLAATALSGAFPPHDPWAVVAIFAVLAVGLWLRSVNYAFWAGGMTAALSLLYGYFGEGGIGLLGTRLEGIVLGAALAVAASWFLLPVRTTDILRRDLSVALAALGGHLTALGDQDDAEAVKAEHRFRQAVRTLDRAAAVLRRVPAPLRPRADYLSPVQALEDCAARLPLKDQRADHIAQLQVTIGELRRAIGERLPPDPVTWRSLPEAITAPAQATETPQAAAPPAKDRFWLSTQKILGYANRVHATSYELVTELAMDETTLTYLVRDEAGHQAQLTWSRDTSAAGLPAGERATASGRTPSGFPYAITEPADRAGQPELAPPS